MTDMGDVSLVLGMGVTRDREKGAVTITQEIPGIYQVPAGAVRHGKLQSIHAWCGKIALAGPSGGEASKQGGKTVVPGHHRQRNVPWTGDSL